MADVIYDNSKGSSHSTVKTDDGQTVRAENVVVVAGGTGGGGDVSSVNGQKGEVVLTGADINATLMNGEVEDTKTITEHLQVLKNDEGQLGDQVQNIQATVNGLDGNVVLKNVSDMQSLSGALTVRDEFWLSELADDTPVTRFSLSTVNKIPTFAADKMDFVGNVNIDGELSINNIKVDSFVGATDSVAGRAGFVPAPKAGDNIFPLMGDGSFLDTDFNYVNSKGVDAIIYHNHRINRTLWHLVSFEDGTRFGHINSGGGVMWDINVDYDKVGIGYENKVNSKSVVIGGYSKSTGSNSILLGYLGEITEDKVFCVSFDRNETYKLLSSDGIIPAERLATAGTAGQVLSKTDTGMAWVDAGGGSGGTDDNGLEGDYATRYGIVDETQSGLPSIVSGSTVKIPAQLVLDVPGVPGLTTNASDITYDIKSTTDCALFLANGEVLEATDVFFQTAEPEDGTTGYAAWWNGTEWKFKSNDTGNVWRAANAVRIAKCVFTDGTLTRLCFTGCRLMNKQEYMPLGNLSMANTTYAVPYFFDSKRNNMRYTGMMNGSNIEFTALIDGATIAGAGYVDKFKASKKRDFITPITDTVKGVAAQVPTEEGTYTLKATVATDGTVTTAWVKDA